MHICNANPFPSLLTTTTTATGTTTIIIIITTTTTTTIIITAINNVAGKKSYRIFMETTAIWSFKISHALHVTLPVEMGMRLISIIPQNIAPVVAKLDTCRTNALNNIERKFVLFVCKDMHINYANR